MSKWLLSLSIIMSCSGKDHEEELLEMIWNQERIFQTQQQIPKTKANINLDVGTVYTS